MLLTNSRSEGDQNINIMDNVHYSRVEALRALMSRNGWEAVIVTASDPHGSEYIAPRWQQVGWLSGFTGEAGDLVVTMDHAGLWTDSRYFIQALSQLEGSGIELHKTRVPGAVGIPEWVARHASVVAVDSLCCSTGFIRSLEDAMKTAGRTDFSLVECPDMFSRMWPDRPSVPVTPIISLSEENVGVSRYDKLNSLRKFLLLQGCDAILLTSLDEIAWTLNVRGSDIDYNPYVISSLLVTMSDAFWFVCKEEEYSDEDTKDSFLELEADGVSIKGYDETENVLQEVFSSEDTSIFVDISTLNHELYHQVLDAVGEQNVTEGASPVILLKAVKNATEIEGMHEAFFEDGLAMEKFLFWLERSVQSGERISEWEASEKLTSFRAMIPGYRGNSFENISAYGANAALPHYHTPESGSALIEPRGLYLTDSGGQYIFGTTDITRTVPMGECTDLEKEDYTLVLKGMIALARAVFPEGTAGCQLDILARNALWQHDRNFGHGTGHGVGFYLGVHEGPQDIRQSFNPQPILPGMITSDEPGLYRENSHGIRHENIILCKEHVTNEFGRWFCFETLTVCHIETSAIIRELMTADETEWLNRYNRSVYERLSPRLDEETASWLWNKTQPL